MPQWQVLITIIDPDGHSQADSSSLCVKCVERFAYSLEQAQAVARQERRNNRPRKAPRPATT